MKDKCVMCGEETLFDSTDHIDMRYGYVEGAGQLCVSCFEPKYKLSVNVPITLIKRTPNDSELGYIVRKMYNNSN
jgi:hypothetical protein